MVRGEQGAVGNVGKGEWGELDKCHHSLAFSKREGEKKKVAK